MKAEEEMKNFLGLILFPIAITIVIIGLIGLQLKVFWEMVTKRK